ncbi:protein-L-isoaspartate O-methyltransferase, partial [bacterium]|nr:protein-L-isoaspartate O-methyltransferase [candidate division CSSED10-310 bacterium]
NDVLAVKAREVLRATGYTHVQVRTSDGYLGWPENAPFNAIIVTCAPSRIPDALQAQLAEGGRMIIPVDVMMGQELILLTKVQGRLERKAVLPVRFVPMIDSSGREY